MRRFMRVRRTGNLGRAGRGLLVGGVRLAAGGGHAGGWGEGGLAGARPEAARPATVFTSIGKKVMMMTTAALDCQSKPNHITMIGATPMIGSAETILPIGKSPRRRNGTRSARIAVMKPAPLPTT